MNRQKSERTFESITNHSPSTLNTFGGDTYEERLNHILNAAVMVIARDGYCKASMRQVALTADVSIAGIYHYFESKEKMLFVIQHRTFTALVSTLRERLLDVDDPIEQLRIMVRSHISFFASNMDWLKVCSQELESLSGSAYEETRKLRHEYFAMTREIIGKLLAATPTTISQDHHVVTMSLFGTLNWLYRWYNPNNDCSPQGLANQITSLFLNGILGSDTLPKQQSPQMQSDHSSKQKTAETDIP